MKALRAHRVVVCDRWILNLFATHAVRTCTARSIYIRSHVHGEHELGISAMEQEDVFYDSTEYIETVNCSPFNMVL